MIRMEITKRRRSVKQKFDLVLGNVDITSSGDGKKKQKAKDGTTSISSSIVERIPSRVHQSIRLGKKSYIESTFFLPDGKGLVTGSSDGFIEVWGKPIKPSSSIEKDDDAASVMPTIKI